MTDLPREHWDVHVKAHLEKLISDAVCTGQGGGGIAPGPGKDTGPGAWGLQALQILMAQQSLWLLWWFPLQSPFHLCALGGSIRKQGTGWPESSPHRDQKKNIYNSVKAKYKTSTVL